MRSQPAHREFPSGQKQRTQQAVMLQCWDEWEDTEEVSKCSLDCCEQLRGSDRAAVSLRQGRTASQGKNIKGSGQADSRDT